MISALELSSIFERVSTHRSFKSCWIFDDFQKYLQRKKKEISKDGKKIE
jgi:hypothetical protein